METKMSDTKIETHTVEGREIARTMPQRPELHVLIYPAKVGGMAIWVTGSTYRERPDIFRHAEEQAARPGACVVTIPAEGEASTAPTQADHDLALSRLAATAASLREAETLVATLRERLAALSPTTKV